MAARARYGKLIRNSFTLDCFLLVDAIGSMAGELRACAGQSRLGEERRVIG